MKEGIYLKVIGRKIKSIRVSNKIRLRKLGELCGLDYANNLRLESSKNDCH